VGTEAAVIAVGDELVGGYTLDTNTHWIAGRLRLAGIPLKRAAQVRDRQDEIVAEIRRCLDDASLGLVFMTGGLGPTPDDRTFEAVAAALGRGLVVWEPVKERIERRLERMVAGGLIDRAELNEGHLRMATIPADPTAVLRNRVGTAPGVLYEVDGKRLLVLPGIPAEMKAIFADEIEPRFLAGGSPATVRELRLHFAVEGRFYPVLRELEATHPDVAVGSYPNFETKELVIRVSGVEAKRVDEALAAVRRHARALGYSIV
jgi:molybdenum cofactor synthesis domain-containing protein